MCQWLSLAGGGEEGAGQQGGAEDTTGVSILIPSGAQGRRLEWAHSFFYNLDFMSYTIFKKSHFWKINLIQ